MKPGGSEPTETQWQVMIRSAVVWTRTSPFVQCVWLVSQSLRSTDEERWRRTDREEPEHSDGSVITGRTTESVSQLTLGRFHCTPLVLAELGPSSLFPREAALAGKVGSQNREPVFRHWLWSCSKSCWLKGTAVVWISILRGSGPGSDVLSDHEIFRELELDPSLTCLCAGSVSFRGNWTQFSGLTLKNYAEQHFKSASQPAGGAGAKWSAVLSSAPSAVTVWGSGHVSRAQK